MKNVSTNQAPTAAGPYSQAIVSGGFVFASGQLGVNKEGVLGADVAEQTELAIRNLSEVLKAAGADLDHVVKTTCFLKNISDFSSFNEIYGRFFTQKPARSLLEASALPKGSLVENGLLHFPPRKISRISMKI